MHKVLRDQSQHGAQLKHGWCPSLKRCSGRLSVSRVRTLLSFPVPEVSFGPESIAGKAYIMSPSITSLYGSSIWVEEECVKLMIQYKSEAFLLTGNKVRLSDILRANICFHVFSSYEGKMSSIIVNVSELILGQAVPPSFISQPRMESTLW